MDQKEFEFYQERKAQLESTMPCDDWLEISDEIRLPLYLAQNQDSNSPRYLVLVLPGGGYEFLSFREDRPVARAFAAKGLNAAVVHYPTRLLQEVTSDGVGVGQQALHMLAQVIESIRKRPELGFVDARIILCGFSAGGHLAATMCTINDSKSLRPDGAILCYPVISSVASLTHKGSMECFSGNHCDDFWKPFSCEKNVHQGTPPAFIWHTATDDAVSVRNSVLYAESMWSHGNIAELHIYPQGRHGLSLAVPEVDPLQPGGFELADHYVARWLDEAVAFVRKFV